MFCIYVFGNSSWYILDFDYPFKKFVGSLIIVLGVRVPCSKLIEGNSLSNELDLIIFEKLDFFDRIFDVEKSSGSSIFYKILNG